MAAKKNTPAKKPAPAKGKIGGSPKASAKKPAPAKGKIVQPKAGVFNPPKKNPVGTIKQTPSRIVQKPTPSAGVIVPGRPVQPVGAVAPVAAPAVAYDPIDPFLTPEEQAELDSAYAQADDQLGQYDANARQVTTDAEYQKLLAKEAAVQMASRTQDRSIARGTYFSSIKDAELFDIDKAKQRQIDYNDQVITDLQTNRDQLVHRLFGSGGMVDIAKKLSTSRAAKNAQDAESNRGLPPTTTPSPAAAAAKPPVVVSQTPQANSKTGAAPGRLVPGEPGVHMTKPKPGMHVVLPFPTKPKPQNKPKSKPQNKPKSKPRAGKMIF